MYVCVSEGREWGARESRGTSGARESRKSRESRESRGTSGGLGNLEGLVGLGNLGNLGNPANFFRDFALIFKQNTQKFAHSRKKLYFCRKITR